MMGERRVQQEALLYEFSLDAVAQPAAFLAKDAQHAAVPPIRPRMPDVHVHSLIYTDRLHMGGARIEGLVAMTPSSSSADGDLAWHSLARFFQCQCQNTIFQLRTDLLLVDLAR